MRAQLARAAGWLVAVAFALGVLARGGQAALADAPRSPEPDPDDALAAGAAGADARGAPDDPPPEGDDFAATRCPAIRGTTCGEPGVPSVDEMVAAAYASAGLAVDPARGWIRRARLAALIPWITVRAGRDTTWQDNDPDIGRSQTYEARATWRLDRLAYDGRELQVASIEAARHREKRRLAARVIRIYFTWLRAHRASARDPRWSLHAAEAASELDALTDGAFTRLGHRGPPGAAR